MNEIQNNFLVNGYNMKIMAQEQRERNEQLERLLAEAEQANMAKTAFLSNMSHDIHGGVRKLT